MLDQSRSHISDHDITINVYEVVLAFGGDSDIFKLVSSTRNKDDDDDDDSEYWQWRQCTLAHVVFLL